MLEHSIHMDTHTHIRSCDPTILQGGDGLTLFTVFTVSNVISGFHPELVGCEWLESVEKESLIECQAFPHTHIKTYWYIADGSSI